MLNDEELKRLLAADPVVAALFKDLAEKTGHSNVTAVEFLQTFHRPDGMAVSRREAIATLQALAAAGCGRFRAGRRGLSTRLEWHVNPIEIAKMALAGDDAGDAGDAATTGSPQEAPAPLPVLQRGRPFASAPGNSPSSATQEKPATYDFRFPLRHGFETCIRLPKNMSADERRRLATAISALPVA